MTFEDGYELSLAYHEGVLNLLMFGEHEWKVFTSTVHPVYRSFKLKNLKI